MTTTRTPEISRYAPRTASLDRDLATQLAVTEYQRGEELLTQLSAEHWSAPTVNTGWDVRATAGHMIGMMEMMGSLAQLIYQQMAAQRVARSAGAPVSIDALTALQVRRNAGLTVDELIGKYRTLVPKAVRGRQRVPAVIRRRTLPERQLVGGRLERWTLGYLIDVVLTRDPFMHRLDIHAATGLPPQITGEHEGRIIDGVVQEWAERHGRPYTLHLTGPAGGHWSTGTGDPIRLDALDFCRVTSGRPAATSNVEPAGLLTTAVPF
ncbi:hypothetical protein Ais01nite_65170 [Asanoa ishikariensis]|uniref:TIGR03083 family protein n=1 Tax=Asanoa ishikariensis TaxID=137265 RepID=A0A1H3NP97_9ACTN|nr:maleylpyruvate isomerase family mycothiol-dependent enzyme [Asanoa ishikariensis]GIF68482.1 hypothetical protein Ais01nite_65170 [Asanoa ishikariensis]SDY90500.1 TIGR03083 family protein [Asanoa ishikariensis]